MMPARSVAVCLGLLALATPARAADEATHRTPLAPPVAQAWVWPLDPAPEVVHVFQPPADPWGAGNRGVDLLGSLAQPVMAIGSGDITFARPLAGRGVVVVRHGALRSTYEPVTASVHVGQHVDAGEVLGLLQTTQSHCFPDVCLHLGLRRGDVYLDPLSVLGPRPVRLKPVTSTGRLDHNAQVPGLSPGPAARQPVHPSSSGDSTVHARARSDPATAVAGAVVVVVAVALLAAILMGRGHARG